MAAPIAHRTWSIETAGFDQLTHDGPAILCPNHVSFLDSVFLLLESPRWIAFLGKAEYLASWRTRAVLPALGMIPIDRTGGANSVGALRRALDVLDRGALLGIFPEGTRSRSGSLLPGRTGAARLALASGCPIFPVGITGTADIQPPDASMPRLGGACRLEIGAPISPMAYRGRRASAARAMTDDVMRAVADLTRQSYHHSTDSVGRGELATVTGLGRRTRTPAGASTETATGRLVGVGG